MGVQVPPTLNVFKYGRGEFLLSNFIFYGSIAQLARAADSYPAGCWFDSNCCYHLYGDALVSTGASKYYETSGGSLIQTNK